MPVKRQQLLLLVDVDKIFDIITRAPLTGKQVWAIRDALGLKKPIKAVALRKARNA